MDRQRFGCLVNNGIIGVLYGGMLCFTTDFFVVLSTGLPGWTPSFLRYSIASIYATILYTFYLPHIRWGFVQDQYRQTLWKLHPKNLIFFAWFLPLATFSCTESLLYLFQKNDPFVVMHFHTLFATGFCLTMALENSKFFEKYRIFYLQDLHD